MPVPPRTFAPEKLAEGQFRYEETEEPLPSIAAFFGIGERTLHTNITRWNWRRRKPLLCKFPPAPESAMPLEATPPAAAPDPRAVAEEIRITVQHEVAAIGAIVARLPRSTSTVEAERTARVLATLTRTLQEVLRLSAPLAPRDEQNHDRGDTDEFLRELARRMDAFADARTGAGIPDPGGTETS